MLQTVKYYLYRILLLFSNTIIWWDWIQRWHISDVKRWQQCSGGVSDQDAPYLRIRVCCKTLKITKLEAAAGQAGKHCLTMFGMERTKTTGLHREHVVSIRTLSITAYIHVCWWLNTAKYARWQQGVSVVSDALVGAGVGVSNIAYMSAGGWLRRPSVLGGSK